MAPPPSSASGAALLRPRRGALWVLLAVDAGLAVAGILLLRAGLASPAAAAVEVGAPTRASAVAPIAEPVKASAAASPASAALAGAAASAGEPAGGGALPPAAARAEPAPASAEPAAEEVVAPAPAVEPPPPAPGDSKRKKARKASSPKERRSGEAPLDPYDTSLVDLAEQLFLRDQPAFDGCFGQALRQAPLVGAAQLTVSFKVLDDGSVGGAGIVRDDTGLPSLGPCVKRVLAGWKLRRGPHEGELAFVTRRVRFRAP